MKMKKWLLLALCLLLALAFVPATAHAEEYSGKCGDGLYWSFDEWTGALTITGNGLMTSTPWRDAGLTSQITSIHLPSGLSICSGAFSHCTGLTHVGIDGSIGSLAFSDCTGLTSVTIFSGVTDIGDCAFSGCTGLTSVTIFNGVTSIGNEMFHGCTGLTSVTIPDSVTSVGRSAFYGCEGLTSVTVPNSVTSIGRGAFYGCKGLTSITIPGSVTSIDSYAFSGCTGLTSVTIPSSVKTIGEGAFSDCDSLVSISVNQDNQYYCSVSSVLFSKDKNVLHGFPAGKKGSYSIPGSVTSIDSYAFSGCTGLTSITIPSSVTSIGSSSFSGCTGLTSVIIPNSVTSIGYAMFRGCTRLTSVTIPSSVTSIDNSAFSGCTGLTSVTIPDGVTSIGISSFSGCTGLTSVTIPDGVTSIGISSFSGCTGLTSVTIPDGVTSIGERAFSGCTRLTSVTIPNSVTIIWNSAFSGCTALKTVNYQGAQAQKESISIKSGNDPLLNAVWTYADAPLRITLDPNGGVCDQEFIEVYRDLAYGPMPTPTRDGYTFAGWWTAKDSGGKEVKENTICYASGDFTLYARWTSKIYTVILNANGGSVSVEDWIVTYNHAYGDLPTPTRSGYTFEGWWTTKDSGGKQVTSSTVCYASGNYTLYARWSKSITVSFNANGGIVSPTSKVVKYGQQYGTLPTPTRSGYTFDGWWTKKDSGGKQVTASTVCYASGNYTLYARWNKGVTVSFNANGGTCGTASKTVTYGQAYGTLPVPKRLGYTFAGWWTVKDAGGKKVTASTICYASGNYTLYARWTEGYTMTFDPNGGTVSPTTKVVKYGQQYGALPTPTRAGYTFAGWWTAKTGGKQVTASTVCYASAGYTLYARWTAKKFVVTLNPNGGECATKTKTVTYGQAYGTMPVPSPRTGYTFAGWYTAKTGGKKVTATTICYATGNYTLYARWTKN